MTEGHKSFYEVIEDAPNYATYVAALASWSTNYGFPTPLGLFLDITGWSHDHLGERLFPTEAVKAHERFGYKECGMLGKALVEYAEAPGPVMEFVEAIMSTEKGA